MIKIYNLIIRRSYAKRENKMSNVTQNYNFYTHFVKHFDRKNYNLSNQRYHETEEKDAKRENKMWMQHRIATFTLTL